MSYILIVQYSYETIDIALCKDNHIIESQSLHKYDAIGQTIPTIDTFLKKNQLTLRDIACIGTNVGPGPYNTLRGLLTMMNGIHTVQKTPLIELNALDLLSSEHASKSHLVMLQAFEGHVFYHLQTPTLRSQGAGSIAQLIDIIHHQPESLHLYGNGAIKYRAQLEAACGSKIMLDTPTQTFNTLETLAHATYKKYSAGEFAVDYVRPRYYEDMAA